MTGTRSTVLVCRPSLALMLAAGLASALAACGPTDVARLDSFGTWCDDAPCGWTLREGTIRREGDGARLGGRLPSVLETSEPIRLPTGPDAPSPGFLAILTQGNSRVTVRWDGPEGVEDELWLSFQEPTYLYFTLDPPRTSGAFTVSLATAKDTSAFVRLVAVTRCGLAGDSRSQFGTWWSSEDPRVRSWYVVEASLHPEGVGSECD